MRSKIDILYQALLARDYRFDGKFFVGVKTTGIYCRPICPAKPKKENVEFFSNALSAEKSGYRPCLRCRPECAPLSPAWIGKSTVVQRALKLIASNQLLDSNEDAFAAQLGISARHLRRLFEEELGRTPKQISDSHRLNFARKLIVETSIPITEIAFTAGFSSVRRFNDAIKKRFHRAPSDLRTGQSRFVPETGIDLTLPYRPPFDWGSLIRFFKTHAIGGVETVTDHAYARVFVVDDAVGGLRLEPSAEKPELKLRVVTEDYKSLFRVVQRARQMFDLDCDPILIANSLSPSSLLDRLCQENPGLRVPRGWDPFETAVGAILGQLVSIKQAARLIKQLVESYGEEVRNPLSGMTAHLFPTPQTLAREALTRLGTTQARKDAIREFARQILEGKVSLEPVQDPSTFKKALLQIKDIGPWTAEYIALRALGDTDAFPHTDLILKRVADLHPDLNLDPIKPWRAYAAMHLWTEYAKPLSKKKEIE